MHASTLKTSAGLATGALLALTMCACGEDHHPTIIDPPCSRCFSPATTPDQVIANLDLAWEERNLAEYDKVLDGDFVFYFSPADVDQLGVLPSWDRTAELASAMKMFTGRSGTTPGGEPAEPVTGFVLRLTPDSPSWDENVPAEHVGTLLRTYDVLMTVTFQGGGTVAVRGRQDFYVVPVQVDGATIYKLRHWVDFGVPGVDARATGEASWGWVKALF